MRLHRVSWNNERRMEKIKQSSLFILGSIMKRGKSSNLLETNIHMSTPEV